MTAIMHINRNVIQRNAKLDVPLPVIRVTEGKDTKYGFEVILQDKQGNDIGKMVYRPDKPLKCGAKLWIEWNGKYEIIGETTWQEMMESGNESLG